MIYLLRYGRTNCYKFGETGNFTKRLAHIKYESVKALCLKRVNYNDYKGKAHRIASADDLNDLTVEERRTVENAIKKALLGCFCCKALGNKDHFIYSGKQDELVAYFNKVVHAEISKVYARRL